MCVLQFWEKTDVRKEAVAKNTFADKDRMGKQTFDAEKLSNSAKMWSFLQVTNKSGWAGPF